MKACASDAWCVDRLFLRFRDVGRDVGAVRRVVAAMTSLFPDARRKLVEGTEVLRTGGGTTLTAGECNAILDRLADLEGAARDLLDYEHQPSRTSLSRLREVLG